MPRLQARVCQTGLLQDLSRIFRRAFMRRRGGEPRTDDGGERAENRVGVRILECFVVHAFEGGIVEDGLGVRRIRDNECREKKPSRRYAYGVHVASCELSGGPCRSVASYHGRYASHF